MTAHYDWPGGREAIARFGPSKAPQVVLALPSSSLAGGFDAPAAQGRFKGLADDRQAGTLRLTAEVAPDSRPRDFLLGPSGKAGYRLVLDLYRGKAATAKAAPAGTRPEIVRGAGCAAESGSTANRLTCMSASGRPSSPVRTPVSILPP